ncbi:MAG: 50S ribosomal protein L10 [Chloroflexi bacterium]|nr:50S ribosomal protein L10 [Chloroflexota bacterium]
MAFSKQHKEVMVDQYREWVDNSKAIFVLSYSKMQMPKVNEARAKLREVDGRLHVVKNRLFTRALEEKGYQYDPKFWEGNNVVVFAFEDAPSVAKALAELLKGNETFEVRGGYLDKASLTVRQVKALSDLPTLPVMRAMLLGTILAPASKLVRTLAEPARGLAAVIKANSEKQPAAA